MTPEKKAEFLHLCPPDNEPEDLEMFTCSALSQVGIGCERDVVLTWSWDLGDFAWGHALCSEHAHEVFGERLPFPKAKE